MVTHRQEQTSGIRHTIKFCLINFLAWGALSLLLTLLVYFNLDDKYSVTFPAFYQRQLPWWISASVITFVVYYTERSTRSRRVLFILSIHFILLIFISVAFNVIRAIYSTSGPITADSVFQTATESRVPDFLSNFFLYVVIATATYAIIAFRDKKKLEADRSHVSKLLAEARLELLTRQLQPHFLFNALNTIAGLVRKKENEEAIKAIDSLGNLLRMCIEQNARVTIPLEEELKLIKHYTLIESIRFRGKLNIDTNVGKDALSVPVPMLILQPIVENAIKHGISKIGTVGQVLIDVKKLQDTLLITIEDNGPGIDSHATQAGVGLKNTRERLRNLYPDNATFSITNRKEGGTRVELNIPVS
jgi:sensor histidine kinase YesM